MPISVNRLAQRILRVKVRVPDAQSDFVEEELKVTFRPLTIGALNRWQEAAREDGKWSIVDELAEILIDMDLTDENGNPVSPGREELETIDIGILRSIHNAIMEESFPNAKI